MLRPVVSLAGAIRRYDWGSPTAIPQLLGIEPTGERMAELWFGTHPDDPAAVPDQETTLDEVIHGDPARMLGAATVDRFGTELPFLIKVLAAGKALSLQVHPNREQARAGYADEEAHGIPCGAPQRTFKDPNHKPELLFALGEFDALCGVRPVEQTLRLFNALGVRELADHAAVLRRPDGVRALVSTWLQLDDPSQAALLDAVIPACRRLADEGGPWALAASHAVLAAFDYPGDIGAVLSLLLNPVRLRPGEAIFLDAGTMHAYLRGVGVEIMAASDNVLRGALTSKHVNVPEFLRVARFSPLEEPRWPAVRTSDIEVRFEVPEPDFVLHRLALDGTANVVAAGPQILLCTDGAAQATAAGYRVPLDKCAGAFVAAGTPVTLTGKGTIFRASTRDPV